MNNKKIKWLIYTVLVGIIPILCRVLVWFVSAKNTSIDLFASSDFIILGLILHISIINEIEHMPDSEQYWKTTQNGFSIVFITFYSVLFALTLLNNVVDANKLIWCAIILVIVSFSISYSVFDRISKIPNQI